MIEAKYSQEPLYTPKYNIHDKKSLSNDKSIVSGYASVFGVRDSQGDVIVHGAFASSIVDFNNGKVVPLLWQHNVEQPIGVIEKLEEDEYGLYVVAKILHEVRQGMEATELIKSRVICNFSIGFCTEEYSLDYESDTRILSKVGLWEVSLVTFPANNQSCITSIN